VISPRLTGDVMRRGRVVALIGFLMTASALPAAACSCAHPTAEAMWDTAGAIFTGVAVNAAPAQPGFSWTTFRVTESFKGANAGATIRVLHRSGSSASCGMQFTLGASHTLYANLREGGLSASRCTSWIFRGEGGPGLIARLRALRAR